MALALAGVLVGAAACGGSSSSGGGSADKGTGTGSGKVGGTMVFGTSADPVSMDGAYVSDGESLRVVKQIFETLGDDQAWGHRDPAAAGDQVRAER